MIKSLLIKNYALIRDLRMEPSAHFNTITGETGAGKSIMLGALGLLLGNRADTKVLFEEGHKCVIEGTFDISQQNLEDLFEQFELDYQVDTIIRREISPSGKSRAFINDTPVTLDVMKELGNFLVDIHSQRDTYLLGTAQHQMRMIDGFAQNRELLESYRSVFREYKKSERTYQELKEHAEEISKESDYNHFLLEELEHAKIEEGELHQLEEELKILEHAEEIKSKLFESHELLENAEFSVNSGLQTVLKNLQQIAQISEQYEAVKARLESCYHELKDLGKDIDQQSHEVEFDKQRQEEVQERVGLLFQLMQKHHVNSETELISIREDLQQKMYKVLNIDDDLKAAEEQFEQSQKELQAIGSNLSTSRLEIIQNFRDSLEALLHELAMNHARIEVRHEQVAPMENGIDKITILFSANAGVQPDELKNVASGGEFSRLMFGIKYFLAGKTSLPTIIFDEIDTGISGEVALKMVRMMKEMASRHQVVAITHLPQIAASGDTHYFVYKEHIDNQSVSKIRQLVLQEREKEIAKMIGGENPTEIAMENARELLGR